MLLPGMSKPSCSLQGDVSVSLPHAWRCDQHAAAQHAEHVNVESVRNMPLAARRSVASQHQGFCKRVCESCTTSMTSDRHRHRQDGELEEREIRGRYSISYYQLGKLPARRLSRRESRACGSRRHALTYYKVADLEALSEQVKRRKVEGHQQAAALPEATEMEWNFADSSGGDIDEIDEMKVAEHYKLPAPKLLRLPYRKLPRKESAELGKAHGRVKIYKLSDIFQLVTNLRAQADEKFEAKAAKREEQQEAKQAAAFEAANKAKALVRTWKKPCLTPGQTSLSMELWGLVLEQALTEDSLWDLRATVQELCNIGLTCKGLHSAVQQQGWPKLCQLLSPLQPPYSTVEAQLQNIKGAKAGQLPDSPDVLINDPASLRMPELKAACRYYGLTPMGTKPELMVRLLEQFCLTRPTSAPLLVVANSKIHAVLVLSGLSLMYHSDYWRTGITVSQSAECHKLRCQLIHTAPQQVQDALSHGVYWRMAADMQSEVEARAAAAIPGLRKAFPNLKAFHELTGYDTRTRTQSALTAIGSTAPYEAG